MVRILLHNMPFEPAKEAGPKPACGRHAPPELDEYDLRTPDAFSNLCLKKRLRKPFLNPPAADTLLRSWASTVCKRLMRLQTYKSKNRSTMEEKK